MPRRPWYTFISLGGDASLYNNIGNHYLCLVADHICQALVGMCECWMSYNSSVSVYILGVKKKQPSTLTLNVRITWIPKTQ